MNYKIIKKGYLGKIFPIPDGKLKKVLIEKLSYKNIFYPGMPKWAMFTKLYKDKKGEFRWGLIQRIEKIFKKWSEITDDTFEIIMEDFEDIEKYNINIDNGLYTYQKDAINNFFKYRLGIFQLPCGSGKTRTAIEIVNRLKLQTIVVVHTKELKSQWESYNNEFIVVMTYQKLLRDFKSLRMLSYIDFIIFDECHLCKCKSIKNSNVFKFKIYTWIICVTTKRRWTRHAN